MNRELVAATMLLGGTVLWTLWNTRPKPLLAKAAPLPPRPVEIDPSVFDQPVHAALMARPLQQPLPPQQQQMETPLGPAGPHDVAAFGLDRERNEDSIGVDAYMSLPLEGDGITHDTRDAYEAVDAEKPAEDPEAFPFYRLRITETRDPFAHYVALGGFKLMHEMSPIDLHDTVRWDPHTGESAPFSGKEAWRATDQRELIVKFPRPVVVTRYQLRTSEEAPPFDPVRWTLQGSRNGAYWLDLDRRDLDVIPAERSVWVNFLIPLAINA